MFSKRPELLAGLAVTLACLVSACSTPPADRVAAPHAGPPPLTSDDGTRQAHLVLNTYGKFPEDMRNLSKEQVQTVHRQVTTVLTEGQTFLKKYPKHERRAKVLYVVARVLTLNLQRFILELDKDYKAKNNGAQPPPGYINGKRDEYIENILQMVEEGLLLEWDDDRKRDLHKVKGYALFVGGRPKQAAIVWRRPVNRYPDDPDLDQAYTSLITALLRSAESDADYRTVVGECDSFLGRFPESPFVPTIRAVREKALNHLQRPPRKKPKEPR